MLKAIDKLYIEIIRCPEESHTPYSKNVLDALATVLNEKFLRSIEMFQDSWDIGERLEA